MTISIVNTPSTAAALQAVCVITLLVFLGQKLLAAAGKSRFAHSLNLALNALLIPLLMAFVLIAVVRVIELL